MSRREKLIFVTIPVISVSAYFLLIAVIPRSWKDAFQSENGPIELGTAAMFLAAATVAIRLMWRFHDQMSRGYQWLFLLFASAGTFVALEELSYGQHLIGWQSPEFFAENNKQSETNLHNMMGSRPSRLVRGVGSFGFPIVCIALPWWFRSRREAYQPAHWTYYLLPKLELAVLVIIAQLVTVPNKGMRGVIGSEWTTRLGELKEFYWSASALAYIYLMYQRQIALRESASEGSVIAFPAEEDRLQRRSAA